MHNKPAVAIPHVLPEEAMHYFRQSPSGSFRIGDGLTVQSSRGGKRKVLMLEGRLVAEYTENGKLRVMR